MKILMPLLLLAVSASAQTQVTRPAPSGTVVGHVTCADTQRPARLADVKLVRVPSQGDEKAGTHVGDGAPAGDPVETALDGSYTLRHVKPGQYYLVVDKEGYLLPLSDFSAKDLASTNDILRAQIAAAVHIISVAADQVTREDVVLQRGASISGTVFYDDGSPASNINVLLLVRDPKSKEQPWVNANLGRYRSSFGSSQTDDNGHYRIAGLPSGEYATEADLAITEMESQTGPMPGNPAVVVQFSTYKSRFSLPLYSGDVFRKPKAVPYTLGIAEIRTGSDLTFPLAKLHKVTGQVVTREGQAVNSGSIDLLYADDKSKMTEASVDLDDQAFHLDFIPEGDFLVQVKGAKDVRKIQVENAPGFTPRTHEETKTVTSYGDAEQALEVKGDLSDILITVPPAKPSGN